MARKERSETLKMRSRETLSSKNSPESYAFNMKATVEDENIQGKISDEDKQKILDKNREVISWLDKNQTAEKEEFEPQQGSWRNLPSCIKHSLEERLGLPWGASSSLWGELPQSLPLKRWIKQPQEQT
ncbi:Heat shock cognate 71 kDa protein [Fukomys damarensis]|uniref:Heat shock cognate 71 kDa protein n=1 Tax=Fukomys damarensis TaxID=885580 RepID=A0A091EIV0_FUKDA|nr:Heat shock cognate 71 kDa protein [Fukomys damarensis]